MSTSLALRILRESQDHPIERIDMGETGDSFLNPEALDILHAIRANSRATIRLFTNFQTFTPDKVEHVLKERLLDQVITNIDGATPESYRAVKRLDLEMVTQHIRHFLKVRAATGCPVSFRIQAVTLAHYTRVVRRALKRNARFVAEPDSERPDDFADIVAYWSKLGILPVRSFVTLWAEAEQAPPSLQRGRLGTWLRRDRCRLLPRMEQSLFVAPDDDVRFLSHFQWVGSPASQGVLLQRTTQTSKENHPWRRR